MFCSPSFSCLSFSFCHWKFLSTALSFVLSVVNNFFKNTSFIFHPSLLFSSFFLNFRSWKVNSIMDGRPKIPFRLSQFSLFYYSRCLPPSDLKQKLVKIFFFSFLLSSVAKSFSSLRFFLYAFPHFSFLFFFLLPLQLFNFFMFSFTRFSVLYWLFLETFLLILAAVYWLQHFLFQPFTCYFSFYYQFSQFYMFVFTSFFLRRFSLLWWCFFLLFIHPCAIRSCLWFFVKMNSPFFFLYTSWTLTICFQVIASTFYS